MLSPFLNMTSSGALCQNHSLSHADSNYFFFFSKNVFRFRFSVFKKKSAQGRRGLGGRTSCGGGVSGARAFVFNTASRFFSNGSKWLDFTLCIATQIWCGALGERLASIPPGPARALQALRDQKRVASTGHRPHCTFIHTAISCVFTLDCLEERV